MQLKGCNRGLSSIRTSMVLDEVGCQPRGTTRVIGEGVQTLMPQGFSS